VGADRIVEALQRLEYLGPHLCPTPLLLDAAKHHWRFYDRTNNGYGESASDSTTAARNVS
jgi:hypothetical protein